MNVVLSAHSQGVPNAKSGRQRKAERSSRRGGGCSRRLRCGRVVGVKGCCWAEAVRALGVRGWSAQVMTKAILCSVAGVRWVAAGCCCWGGADKVAHRRGGFRVEVVISLYGGEACSRSVRRGAVRCEGSNGIEGMRCGSKVGLWHFDFGPWPWTHAPVSAAWRRIVKGGPSCFCCCSTWAESAESAEEIHGYLAHGYRLPVERFAPIWVGAAAAGHVPGYMSGYRVLLAGQETERDTYGLGQARKVYGTFLHLQQGERARGRRGRDDEECSRESVASPLYLPTCLGSCILETAPPQIIPYMVQQHA